MHKGSFSNHLIIAFYNYKLMIKIPPDLIKCVFPHPIKFHKINIFTSNPWWFEGKSLYLQQL